MDNIPCTHGVPICKYSQVYSLSHGHFYLTCPLTNTLHTVNSNYHTTFRVQDDLVTVAAIARTLQDATLINLALSWGQSSSIQVKADINQLSWIVQLQI